MKKNKKLFVVTFLCSSVLFSCGGGSLNPFDNSASSSDKSSSITSSNETLSSNTSINSSSNNSSVTSTSTSSSTSEEIQDKDVILDFYNLNDLHGRILENKALHEPGIAKISTFLTKEKAKNPEGYVFMNTGDMWQDTYESRVNNGFLITDALEAMDCEAFVLGNHEFDWGVDVLKDNIKRTNKMSFLGANVYKYPSTEEFAHLGEEYKIIERQGVKIGIIGTIGSTQNTSMTSSVWENLSFKVTTPVVQNLSDKLRTQEGCDLIVYGTHTDYISSDPTEITKISPISHKKYVDIVFNGHTHQDQLYMENGVPFVQAGAHGEALGHIQVKVSKNKEVEYQIHNILGKNQMNSLEADPKIQRIVDSYLTEDVLNTMNEEIGTFESSYKIDDKLGGNFYNKALSYLYPNEFKGVDFMMNNGVRTEVNGGVLTTKDLFNMMPFTNKILICKNISGKDILNELRWGNSIYRFDTNQTIERDKTYTLACIDYLLLHKNAKRQYDYFPSFNSQNILGEITENPYKTLSRYLKIQKVVHASDFNGKEFQA